jgi:hypothetical protein
VINVTLAADCFVLLKHGCLPFSLIDTRHTDVCAALIHEYINTNHSTHVCTANAEIGWTYLNNPGSILRKEVYRWVPDGVDVLLMSRFVLGALSAKLRA